MNTRKKGEVKKVESLKKGTKNEKRRRRRRR
jgi:hypothetical protein